MQRNQMKMQQKQIWLTKENFVSNYSAEKEKKSDIVI